MEKNHEALKTYSFNPLPGFILGIEQPLPHIRFKVAWNVELEVSTGTWVSWFFHELRTSNARTVDKTHDTSPTWFSSSGTEQKYPELAHPALGHSSTTQTTSSANSVSPSSNTARQSPHTAIQCPNVYQHDIRQSKHKKYESMTKTHPKTGSGNLLSNNFADFSISSVKNNNGKALLTPGAADNSFIFVSYHTAVTCLIRS
jgi:hypothetical protein